jgi:hypothetical protein
MRQVERALQREVMARLSHAPLDALVIGSPNGIWIPAGTAAEQEMARRIVHQLKALGQLTPGAPDLLFLWRDGSGGIELKRPPEARLFGRQPRGRQSDEQLAFEARSERHGVRYAVCQSWDEVRDTLILWGRLPAGWLDPERRIGRAA